MCLALSIFPLPSLRLVKRCFHANLAAIDFRGQCRCWDGLALDGRDVGVAAP
jgi:hypothetical protein